MARWLLLVATIIVLAALSLAASPPSCKLTQGGITTDISRLTGVYQTGVVQQATDPPGYVYTVAICQDVQEKCYQMNKPSNIFDSVTQNRPPGFVGGFCKRLGSWNENSQVRWLNPDNPAAGVTLIYADGTPYNHINLNRTTQIDIYCNDKYGDLNNPDVAFDHEDGDMAGVYYFKVNSVAGCPISSGGLSGGWIFVIIFFSALAVYIAVGVAYNLIARKLTGAEALPNYGFWKQFFGCVLDGVRLVFCCRSPASYNQFDSGSGSAKGGAYSANADAGGYQTGI